MESNIRVVLEHETTEIGIRLGTSTTQTSIDSLCRKFRSIISPKTLLDGKLSSDYVNIKGFTVLNCAIERGLDINGVIQQILLNAPPYAMELCERDSLLYLQTDLSLA